MAKQRKNKIIPIILIVIIAVCVGKNLIIKMGTQAGVKAVTGLSLKIGKFHVGVFDTKVHIKEFQLQNPKGYQDRIMVDIPEVYVDYRLLPIFTGKVHLDEIRFHLKEFVVVKNADGTSNLDSLKVVQDSSKKEKKDAPKKDAPKKKTKVQIDNLSLRIDKVILKVYNEDGKAKVKEFNINLNEVYKDIKSFEDIAALIVFKIATKTTIGSIVNLDVDGLGDMFSGSLGSATDAAVQAQKAVNSTKDKLKGLIKNPFGKE